MRLISKLLYLCWISMLFSLSTGYLYAYNTCDNTTETLLIGTNKTDRLHRWYSFAVPENLVKLKISLANKNLITSTNLNLRETCESAVFYDSEGAIINREENGELVIDITAYQGKTIKVYTTFYSDDLILGGETVDGMTVLPEVEDISFKYGETISIDIENRNSELLKVEFEGDDKGFITINGNVIEGTATAGVQDIKIYEVDEEGVKTSVEQIISVTNQVDPSGKKVQTISNLLDSMVSIGYPEELEVISNSGSAYTFEIINGNEFATLEGKILTGVAAGEVELKVTVEETDEFLGGTKNLRLEVSAYKSGIPYKEFMALEKLYEATGGDDWESNTNWLSDAPINEWKGLSTKRQYDENNKSYNSVSYISLSDNNLVGGIPDEIKDFKNLEGLSLSNNNLASLPSSISQLKLLRSLYLSDNPSIELTDDMKGLESLTILSMRGLGLNVIPSFIEDLSNLESLDLSYNNLSELPSFIGNLANLKYLSVMGNKLTGLPSEMSNLSKLELLNMINNLIDIFPTTILDITSLKKLELSRNAIQVIPDDIDKLVKLEELKVDNNYLKELPQTLNSAKTFRRLHLQYNYLSFEDLDKVKENIKDDITFNYYTFQKNVDYFLNITQDKEKKETTLTVPGTSETNIYRWFRNSSLLENETGPSITINYEEENGSRFYCSITNSEWPDISFSTGGYKERGERIHLIVNNVPQDTPEGANIYLTNTYSNSHEYLMKYNAEKQYYETYIPYSQGEMKFILTIAGHTHFGEVDENDELVKREYNFSEIDDETFILDDIYKWKNLPTVDSNCEESILLKDGSYAAPSVESNWYHYIATTDTELYFRIGLNGPYSIKEYRQSCGTEEIYSTSGQISNGTAVRDQILRKGEHLFVNIRSNDFERQTAFEINFKATPIKTYTLESIPENTPEDHTIYAKIDQFEEKYPLELNESTGLYEVVFPDTLDQVDFSFYIDGYDSFVEIDQDGNPIVRSTVEASEEQVIKISSIERWKNIPARISSCDDPIVLDSLGEYIATIFKNDAIRIKNHWYSYTAQEDIHLSFSKNEYNPDNTGYLELYNECSGRSIKYKYDSHNTIKLDYKVSKGETILIGWKNFADHFEWKLGELKTIKVDSLPSNTPENVDIIVKGDFDDNQDYKLEYNENTDKYEFHIPYYSDREYNFGFYLNGYEQFHEINTQGEKVIHSVNLLSSIDSIDLGAIDSWSEVPIETNCDNPLEAKIGLNEAVSDYNIYQFVVPEGMKNLILKIDVNKGGSLGIRDACDGDVIISKYLGYAGDLIDLNVSEFVGDTLWISAHGSSYNNYYNWFLEGKDSLNRSYKDELNLQDIDIWYGESVSIINYLENRPINDIKIDIEGEDLGILSVSGDNITALEKEGTQQLKASITNELGEVIVVELFNVTVKIDESSKKRSVIYSLENAVTNIASSISLNAVTNSNGAISYSLLETELASLDGDLLSTNQQTGKVDIVVSIDETDEFTALKDTLSVQISPYKNGIPYVEWIALEAIYNALDGDNWERNTLWLSESAVFQWYGISTIEQTDENGEIFHSINRINIINNNAKGDIPSEIGYLINLKNLSMRYNNVTSLPAEIGKLKKLEQISLDNNKLKALPNEIGNLVSLNRIYLDENNLSSLPLTMVNLENLKSIYLNGNPIEKIDDELFNLKSLNHLHLSSTKLSEVPTSVKNAGKLTELYLENNNLTSLPLELKENKPSNFSLRVAYNALTFGDLDSLQGFVKTYNRQDEIPIGHKQDLENQTRTLSVDSNSENNTFQWYKNDEAIEGETTSSLTYKYDDSLDANYYCKINNTDWPSLTLTSEPFSEKGELISFILYTIPDNTPEDVSIQAIGNFEGAFDLEYNQDEMHYEVFIPKSVADTLQFNFALKGHEFYKELNIDGEEFERQQILGELSGQIVINNILGWKELPILAYNCDESVLAKIGDNTAGGTGIWYHYTAPKDEVLIFRLDESITQGARVSVYEGNCDNTYLGGRIFYNASNYSYEHAVMEGETIKIKLASRDFNKDEVLKWNLSSVDIQDQTISQLKAKDFKIGDYRLFYLRTDQNNRVNVDVVEGNALVENDSLKITDTGKLTLRYYNEGELYYRGVDSLVTYTVTKYEQSFSTYFFESLISADKYLLPSFTTNELLPLTVTSLSENAEINNDTLLITKPGEVKIKLSNEGNDIYSAFDTTFVVEILKKDQFLYISPFSQITKVGKSLPFILSNSELDFSFEVLSSNATMLGDTLSITAGGDVEVRVYNEGDDDYAPYSAVYTFTVEKENQSFSTDYFNQITKVGNYYLPKMASNQGLSFTIEANENALIDGDTLRLLSAVDVQITVSNEGTDFYKPFEKVYTISNLDRLDQSFEFMSFLDTINEIGLFEFPLLETDAGLSLKVEVLSDNAYVAGTSALNVIRPGEVVLRLYNEETNMYNAYDQTYSIYVDKLIQLFETDFFDSITEIGDYVMPTFWAQLSLRELNVEGVTDNVEVRGDTLSISEGGEVQVRVFNDSTAIYQAYDSIFTFNIQKGIQTFSTDYFDDITKKGTYELPEFKTDQGNDIVVSVVSGDAIIENNNLIINSAGTIELNVVSESTATYEGFEDTYTLEIQEEEDPTGLNDELSSQIKLYPNPARNIVVIEYNEFSLNSEVIILTLDGKQVLKKILDSNKKQLDISTLNTGVYLLQINTDKGIGVKRLIVN